MNNNIDTGRIIREVFDIYRDQAVVLLPVALVVFGLEGLVRGALVAVSPLLIVVAVIIQILARYLYQGMVVQLVADVQDGRRDNSVGDLFRSVTPVLLPLILVGILAGIGIGIGFVLLIIPGLFLLTIWSVVSPVVVLERPGVIGAFTRSQELVKGNGWQVFGVIVVFFLILLALGFVLGLIGAALGPTGQVLAGIVSSVIAAPLVALAGTVLYFHLRAAHGGLAAPGASPAGVGASSAGTPVGAGAEPSTTGPGAHPGSPAAPASPPPGQQGTAPPPVPGGSAGPGQDRPGGEPRPDRPS
jgi:hypothetical protein